MKLTIEGTGTPLDASDSAIVGYERSGDSAFVRLKLWDSTPVEIEFRGIVLLHDGLAGPVDQLRATTTGGHALEAVQQVSGNQAAAVVEYQFVDPDDRVSLSVVCIAGSQVLARLWERGTKVGNRD